MRAWILGLSLGSALMLAGCSDAELASLEQRLGELRSRPSGKVAPLPETPQYHAVTYDQAGRRSPFMPELPEPEKAASAGQDLAPDLSRPRDPLEAYPLDELTLVGTLHIDGHRSALVRDPRGQVHRLFAGDYLGTDFGRIVAVTDASVQLVEIVSNGQSGWIERSRALSLNDSDNDSGERGLQ
ncbi:MAG: pilus assembly protein PilP [Halomonas sp.]|nr:pilus assembly protein PilP [Halomonas sp.]